jgi:prepilin-type N-terminal cleavage/methylation domain-containing protein
VLKHRCRPIRTGQAAFVGQNGFTLLELVVVLALLALLLGLVLPGLQHNIARERDRANLRQLTATLRLARSRAATTRQRVRLFVNPETGKYWLEGTNRRGVLTGMRLGDTRLVWQDRTRHQGYIAFYGDGSSSGGKLALEDSAGRHYDLEVEIITGRVTLKIEAHT